MIRFYGMSRRVVVVVVPADDGDLPRRAYLGYLAGGKRKDPRCLTNPPSLLSVVAFVVHRARACR
uniref:Uncharacterized protein n=1 Tax=Oryza rufipogon TaxID=4529 RepID=A0A0E0Q9C3_ORYRU